MTKELYLKMRFYLNEIGDKGTELAICDGTKIVSEKYGFEVIDNDGVYELKTGTDKEVKSCWRAIKKKTPIGLYRWSGIKKANKVDAVIERTIEYFVAHCTDYHYKWRGVAWAFGNACVKDTPTGCGYGKEGIEDDLRVYLTDEQIEYIRNKCGIYSYRVETY